MSSNTRGGRTWPSGVAKGRSQIEAVTAGVDEVAGGQMGLAKTLGEDEGGSEIKAEAGVDDTGMGITGLWAESSTVMSTSWGCCCWFQFLYECITEIKLSRCGRLLLLFTSVNSTSSGHQTGQHASFPIQAQISLHENTPYKFCKSTGNWLWVLKFLHLTTALLFNLAL